MPPHKPKRRAATRHPAAPICLPRPLPERDLATINSQTRRLVEYSLAVASALPFGARGSTCCRPWTPSTSPMAEDGQRDEERRSRLTGNKQSKSNDGTREVTLGDLCLAVIVLATTVIAAKNIPGLLEMAVLQHLPVDAGAATPWPPSAAT